MTWWVIGLERYVKARFQRVLSDILKVRSLFQGHGGATEVFSPKISLKALESMD